MRTIQSKALPTFLILAVMCALVSFPKLVAAASITGLSDTMSSQAKNVTADHTIAWTQATGHAIAAGDTVAIAYTTSGAFTANAAGSWQTNDFSYTDTHHTALAPIAVGASPACTSTDNYTVTVSGTVLPVFTITACSGWTSPATGSAVSFTIKGATGGTGTLTNANADTDSITYTVTDAGSNTDVGTGADVIETNDVVTVSATVNPVLTFSNDQTTVAFGALSTIAARYANNTSGSSTDGTANTLGIATNAPSGYTLTYQGATLTDASSDTIPAATISGSATGTPGTSQFAISGTMTTAGTGAMASAYNHATPNWNFVAGSAQTLATSTAPVAGDSVAVHYLANVSAAQPAGSYTTAITYIAVGNF